MVMLRETMKQAHETGKPVMRAMWYMFTNDENCVNMQDDYMFGDKYLVAPVTKPGVRKRTVYFPQQTKWKDVDTGAVYPGGQYAEIDAPLDRIPVFEIME